MSSAFIPEISKLATAIPLDNDDPLAIDWLNGRRTPDANQELKGALLGLNLGTSAAHLFKAWVEATCFGAKAIVDRFNAEGVPVKGLIGLGGVARKSPYIMQVMADVINMPIRIHRSEQTCALGAAMFAATAGGLYVRVEDAMAKMGQGFDHSYEPDSSKTDLYARRFQKYLRAGSMLENLTENTPIKEYQV
jgi:L-ribulokinase